MKKEEILSLIKLLSALESWSFANSKPIPDYLLLRLDAAIEQLSAEVLK